jgi:hypothetical protein
MKVNPVYISIDIETNGPIPGDYSMLSLGAVAYNEEGKKLSSFFANLVPLHAEKAVDQKKLGHPETMAWWADYPHQYAAATRNQEDPREVMKKFQSWIINFGMVPVAVCYPSWDYMFIHWYFIHFLNQNPLGLSCLDLKTYIMKVLNTPFRKTVKKNMPKEWFDQNAKHTHIAVEDAEEQGNLFFKAMNAGNK